jgi:N-acetylglucosaminyldiphosphoundecaprenol N-acetyl-beta-D-mannosaminyltransferase
MVTFFRVGRNATERKPKREFSEQVPMKPTTRLPILNIWVDPVDREEAKRRVREMLKTARRPCCVFASNPEKNFSVPKDPLLYEVYRNADILLPDGIGVVAAARLLHGVRLKRLAGSDFIFDLCEIAEETGSRLFVYGAKEEVNKISVRELQRRYPRLVVAGRANGYVPKEKMDGLIGQINATKADILLLALGSPRQEKWFAEYAASLSTVKVVQGVGGTLDTLAGTVRRAPLFWRRLNLEWLYRLLREPVRIKRQRMLPFFVVSLLYAKVFQSSGARPKRSRSL